MIYLVFCSILGISENNLEGSSNFLISIAKTINEYGFFSFLGSVLAIIIVWISPMLITIIKDRLRKKDDKELYSVLSELTEQLRILVKQYRNSISYDMVVVLMESLMTNSSQEICLFMRGVIDQNNLKENRSSIEARIRFEIDTQFERLKTRLNLFDYKGKPLRDLIKDAWKKEITSSIIKILFDETLPITKRQNNIIEYLPKIFYNLSYEILMNIKKI